MLINTEKKLYVVWNSEKRTEGFITDDYEDALNATDIEYNDGSSMATEFGQTYGDTSFIQTVISMEVKTEDP